MLFFFFLPSFPLPLPLPFLPAVCDDMRWAGVMFLLCPRRRSQGILTTTDYINLTQCESLEDVRMHLTVRGCLCCGGARVHTGATDAESARAVRVCVGCGGSGAGSAGRPSLRSMAMQRGAAQRERALLAGVACRYQASLLDIRETHTRTTRLVVVAPGGRLCGLCT